MEFPMRSKTFISSMVGVAAAAAVAGSANAAFVDNFTVGSTSSTGPGGDNLNSGSPFDYRFYNFYNPSNTAIANVDSVNQTLNLSREANDGTLQLGVVWEKTSPPYLDWTGLQSISFNISSTTGGTLFVQVGEGSSTTDTRWTNFSIGTGSQLVTLNVGSAYGGGSYSQGASFSDASISRVRLSVTQGTSAFSGTITNLQYNIVPAPGAVALLGVAGLVGARRRRA